MLTQDMTVEQMKAEIAALKAELLAKATVKVSIKLSAKGGISVYGLGRWPVTLYAGQWRTLLGQTKAIEGFIEANAVVLAEAETAWQAQKAIGAGTVAATADPVADEAERRAAEVDKRLAAA